MSIQCFDTILESKSIRDIAYETLKQAIIIGKIPAGSRIVETTYADKLHISRTPLREALRKLERDGLVEYSLPRGVIVLPFTINNIDEIFTIHNALMMLILPSIIESVTEKQIEEMRLLLAEMDIKQDQADVDTLVLLNRAFHSKIEHISNRLRILRVIDSQEEYIVRFSAIAIASIVRRTNAHQEHHKILDLLFARDLEGLKLLTRHHLEESKETCLKAFANRIL